MGATDLQAMIIADPCLVVKQLSGVFHKRRDFSEDQGLLEDGSGAGVGLLGVEMQVVDWLCGIRAFIDGVHGAVTSGRAEVHDFSPVVEADLAENFLNIEQLFSVVINPRKYHKWRDKSVVLRLWCDTLDEQGMFSLEKLDVLQMLFRLVWNWAATYYEQLLLDFWFDAWLLLISLTLIWLVNRFRYEGLLIRSGQQVGVSNDIRFGVIYVRFKPHSRIFNYFGIFLTFPAAATAGGVLLSSKSVSNGMLGLQFWFLLQGIIV